MFLILGFFVGLVFGGCSLCIRICLVCLICDGLLVVCCGRVLRWVVCFVYGGWYGWWSCWLRLVLFWSWWIVGCVFCLVGSVSGW